MDPGQRPRPRLRAHPTLIWGRQHRAETVPDERERARIARADLLAGLAHRGFELLEDVHDVGRGYHADRQGRLWRREPGEERGGRVAGVDAFIVASSLRPAWCRRPAPNEPQTLEELEQMREATRAKAELAAVERRAAADARRKNPPERVLVLGDVERTIGAQTLRGLVERLEAAGGCLVVEGDGGLTVRAAPVGEEVVRLGYILSGASETILAAVKHRAGPIDPERLPDMELTVGGDLLPAGLVGRDGSP